MKIMHPLSLQQDRQKQQHNDQQRYWIALVVITVLFFLYLNFQPQQQERSAGENGSSISTMKTMKTTTTSKIQTGRNKHGIDYYQCNNDGSAKKHLVLLHGSKFTKEDWKTSGILQDFCSYPIIVSAIDLPVSAGYQELQQLLNDLALPVTGLVTPSASGKTITDWIMNGPVEELPKYIDWWIPVASGSVHQLSTTQLQTLQSVKILSIYGDQDPNMGHDTSAKLQQWSNAVSVEIPGRHPCYLDSPKQFVTIIIKNIIP
jgi:hypothetical protein